MPNGIEVSPVADEELEELLPLIAAYQDFYEAEQVGIDRNRRFFRRFLAPSEDGMLLRARAAGAGEAPAEAGPIRGYACLYWHFSSTRAAETVLMNDLFVAAEARGKGVGRALIEASAAVARERGAAKLEWSTRPDNAAAQRLYDATGAERSDWIEYELRL